MFDDYDTSGDQRLDAREIMSVLCRHGYALDVKGVSSIIHEIKGQHIDTLDRTDFLKFMRKAREREIVIVRDLFVNCDSDGSAGISFNELGSILGSLGYVPQAKTINEAAADIGLHKGIHRDLTFAEVWQFLEIYRLHHGLSQTDYAEVESAYRKFDSDGNGVLEPPEVARLLRHMGYPITYQTCMRLLSLELDSTHIDLQEFVELVRKYRERLTKIIYAEITANEESPGAVKLSSNSYFAKRRVSFSAAESAATPTSAAATASHAKQPVGSMQKSVSRAMAVLEEGRSTVKKNSGFDPKEIEDLKKQFVYYDTDHSGEISKSELHPLFGDLFPELMTLASGSQTRRELQRLFDEADSDHNRALSFLEFLQLVRKWSDYQDGVRYRMEVQATEQTGFSAREVAEFRELFMGDGGRRTQLDYEDLCKMLQHVVPLGHKNLAQLAEVFEDMAPLATPDVRKADFSDFLLIMKHLLDINFAGISSIDSGSKRPRSSD
jgi:Ca2+-binding EF-hand superfamily protein